ncbi:transporter [Rhizobium sp. AC27/96]|uniref:BON domain-containing protein n=1 Tax=Rhizobium TaxID=379 RepID=UPI0008289A25|nr:MULTISPECIES: BON domain-containing protein [Rhizobium]NTF46598.1 BON domain-containing protein [Rhizobium rhizogenes]OCI99612.1 transporter [Rhizobium sp. AC27/96]
MKQPRNPKPLSREEDYRDYEDRDEREGWPYADEDAKASSNPENAAYGDTTANFDEEPNSSFIIDATDEIGAEEDTAHTANPLSPDRIDSDQLEAVITERLAEVNDVDADSIDVKAENGIVTLEGSVDTVRLARHIETLVLSVAGVLEVRNNLRTMGVDSHIPPDA